MSAANSLMTQLLSAITKYVGLGWRLFPAKPDKTPKTNRGFKDATNDLGKLLAWWKQLPPPLIGVRTGPESGVFVVDLDVDRQKGIDGTAWLGKQEATHGPLPNTIRAQTPRGGIHLYFKYPADRRVGNSAGRLAAGVDVRGDGGYVIAPPSVGDAGSYQWLESPSDCEVATAPEWLLDVVCDAPLPPPQSSAVAVATEDLSEADRNAIKAEIAKHIGAVKVAREGTRNHALNKASFCLAMLVGAKVADEAELEAVLLAAAESVGLPTAEALRTIRSGFRAGKQRPWRPYAAEPTLSAINREYFFALDGRASFVFHEELDSESGIRRLTYITPAAFKDWFGNQFVMAAMPDGSRRAISAGLAWLKWNRRRQYKKIMFAPGRTLPPDIYNQWQGFGAEPVEGDCSKFLAFMHEVVCSGDSEAFHYLIHWCARAVQEPASPGQVAIVMRGSKGAGKSFFATHFGELFGDHFVQMSNSHHLVGNFNAHLETAIVVFADEAFWAGDKQGEGTLKTLITSDTIRVERKGIDSKNARNHVHLIMASNSDWVVPASTDERRYLVLDVSSERAQDHTYFAALEAEWRAGGREAFMYHLLHLSLGEFNVRKVPRSEALLQQKLLSLSPIDRWYLDMLRSGSNSSHATSDEDPWTDWVPTSELYATCLEFAKKEQTRFAGTQEAFGMRLVRLLPPPDVRGGQRRTQRQEAGKRMWGYSFPEIGVCRKHFEKLIGAEIEWQTEGEAPPYSTSRGMF